jgi:hypothetical protein
MAGTRELLDMPASGGCRLSDTLTDEEKATFRAAGERRKAAAIRLKRFAVMCDANQAESLNVLWESWVERFGKQLAVDHLIKMWSHAEARLGDRRNAQNKT